MRLVNLRLLAIFGLISAIQLELDSIKEDILPPPPPVGLNATSNFTGPGLPFPPPPPPFGLNKSDNSSWPVLPFPPPPPPTDLNETTNLPKPAPLPKPHPRPNPRPPSAIDSIPVTTAYEAKIYDYSGGEYRRFGYAVAANERFVAVGCNYESSYASVAVFREETYQTQVSNSNTSLSLDTWAQDPPATSANYNYDGFGLAMSVNNHSLMVGAPYDSTKGYNAGAVHVYSLSGAEQSAWGEGGDDSTGSQELAYTLSADDAASGATFGFSVASDNNTLVVGAPKAYAGAAQAGAAYVFQFNQSTSEWSQQAKLVLNSSLDPSFSHFGSAVSLSDSLIAVAAPGYSQEATRAGAVFLFAFVQQQTLVSAAVDNSTANETAPLTTASGAYQWSQVATLQATVPVAYAQFGTAMTFVGSLGLVSALDEDGEGLVYVFSADRQGSWSQTAVLRPEASAYSSMFGESLALYETLVTVNVSRAAEAESRLSSSGRVLEEDQLQNETVTLALIGAPGDDSAGQSSGSVYVFASRQSTHQYTQSGMNGTGELHEWHFVDKATANDSSDFTSYGRSLVLSGDTLVVGADQATTPVAERAGAVYMEVNLLPFYAQLAQSTVLNGSDSNSTAGGGTGNSTLNEDDDDFVKVVSGSGSSSGSKGSPWTSTLAIALYVGLPIVLLALVILVCSFKSAYPQAGAQGCFRRGYQSTGSEEGEVHSPSAGRPLSVSGDGLSTDTAPAGRVSQEGRRRSLTSADEETGLTGGGPDSTGHPRSHQEGKFDRGLDFSSLLTRNPLTSPGEKKGLLGRSNSYRGLGDTEGLGSPVLISPGSGAASKGPVKIMV